MEKLEKIENNELNQDYCLRVVNDTAEIRAFICDTTNLVETARKNHQTTNVATAALGRTLTGTMMMGLMLKDESNKCTVIIKGGGPIGTILATSDFKGNVKGYCSNPDVESTNYENGKLNVAKAVGNTGIMKVIKDLGMKEPYNGQYEMVSGEIAEDFAYYFTASEQTPSAVYLEVLTTEEKVYHAGGIIVQLMPFASEETITKLEENLKNISSITNMLKEGHTPESITDIVFDGLNPKILDKIPCNFVCDCSREKVENALISIGKKELEAIINEDEKADLDCQFCNSKYHFTKEDLEKIYNNM